MQKRIASELSKRIGYELKADRGRRGWTLKAVERETGISYKTLTRMLNGETEISVNSLIAIASAIGTTAAAIIREADRHAPGGSLTNVVSLPPANVTALHDTDWDTYEGRRAATNDEEASEDEPAGP